MNFSRTDEMQGVFQKRVAAGPFRGCWCGPARGAAGVARAMGTWRAKLNSVVEEVCRDGADRLLVGGDAGGYYTAGFAMRLPEARVLVVLRGSRERKLLAGLADQQGVADQVLWVATPMVKHLEALLQEAGRPVVFCGELGLFDGLLAGVSTEALGAAWLVLRVDASLTEEAVRARYGRLSASHTLTWLDASPAGEGEAVGGEPWVCLKPRGRGAGRGQGLTFRR